MEPSYLLYSTRLQSWMTRAMTGTSDWSKAARFEREEALNIAREQRDWNGAIIIFPVAADDLTEVSK